MRIIKNVLIKIVRGQMKKIIIIIFLVGLIGFWYSNNWRKNQIMAAAVEAQEATLTGQILTQTDIPVENNKEEAANDAQAQEEESFEARVAQILGEKTVTLANSKEEQLSQNLRLEITSGAKKGTTIDLENGSLPLVNRQRYEVGDRLVIGGSAGNYYIADVVRRPVLAWLFVIFVVAAISVGRGQGLSSLIGLGASFWVIFWFVLPKIAAGDDPIIIVILACLVIVPLMFILSHGLNKKTWVAMTATILAMIITGLLIMFFVNAAELTGLASEEAGFLQAMNPGLINLKNLLIAGMLFATLGVLDDITISQAAVIEELKKAKPEIKIGQLYKQAMKVGRDHIASMINTLILVYAGASFPLLLMFEQSQQSLGLTLNFELIADEIVRTLTGSIGLILAVPLTTILAAVIETWRGGE